jgi:hypothetical protein
MLLHDRLDQPQKGGDPISLFHLNVNIEPTVAA